MSRIFSLAILLCLLGCRGLAPMDGARSSEEPVATRPDFGVQFIYNADSFHDWESGGRIHVWRMDAEGRLTPVQVLTGNAPEMLRLTSSQRFIYMANHFDASHGIITSRPPGRFRINPDGTLLATQSHLTHQDTFPSEGFVFRRGSTIQGRCTEYTVLKHDEETGELTPMEKIPLGPYCTEWISRLTPRWAILTGDAGGSEVIQLARRDLTTGQFLRSSSIPAPRCGSNYILDPNLRFILFACYPDIFQPASTVYMGLSESGEPAGQMIQQDGFLPVGTDPAGEYLIASAHVKDAPPVIYRIGSSGQLTRTDTLDPARFPSRSWIDGRLKFDESGHYLISIIRNTVATYRFDRVRGTVDPVPVSELTFAPGADYVSSDHVLTFIPGRRPFIN